MNTFKYNNIPGVVLEKSPGALYKCFWDQKICLFLYAGEKWLKFISCYNKENAFFSPLSAFSPKDIDYSSGRFESELEMESSYDVRFSHPQDVKWLKEYDPDFAMRNRYMYPPEPIVEI